MIKKTGKKGKARALPEKGAQKRPRKNSEKKKKKSLKAPKLGWRLGLSAFFGLILVLGTIFIFGELKNLVTRGEEKRNQQEALAQKDESYVSLKTGLSSISQEIGVLEKALVKEATILNLLKEMEGFEEENGVVLSSLAFNQEKPVPDKEGFFYLELVIEASGPVGSLEDFLEKVLSLPYLLEAKTIKVSQLEGGESVLTLVAKLYVDPNFYPSLEK